MAIFSPAFALIDRVPCSSNSSMPTPVSPEEYKQQADEARAKALATFPFERVEVTGEEALAAWERLKRAGRGLPVVLGSDGAVADLTIHFRPDWPASRSAEE